MVTVLCWGLKFEVGWDFTVAATSVLRLSRSPTVCPAGLTNQCLLCLLSARGKEQETPEEPLSLNQVRKQSIDHFHYTSPKTGT